MILQRLYELAEREELTGDPAFDAAPIACLITLSAGGEYLGMKDLRESQTIPPRTAKGKPRQVLDKGKAMPVPVRAVVFDAKHPANDHWKLTDPASSGKERPAAFVVDTLPRVLPIDRLIPPEKVNGAQLQRRTFWRFVKYAAQKSGCPSMSALSSFGDKLLNDSTLCERISNDVEKLQFADGLLCTFSISEDRGPAVVESARIMDWWRAFHSQDIGAQSGVVGHCQVIGKPLLLADSIKVRVSGLIRIGCRADAYVVTSLEASESFGMSGAVSAMVSEQAIDACTRALNALIGNELPSKHRSSLVVGNAIYLFWTREAIDLSDVIASFDAPDPASIERLLASVHSGQQRHDADPGGFYCLTLSGNAARAVVRDYLEAPVGRVKANLARWFTDLRIVDEWGKETRSAFPLWMLVSATASEAKEASPAVGPALLHAAIRDAPLPDSLLASCVRRLQAEAGKDRDGFSAARMALIKLVLNRGSRKGELMSEALNEAETSPAYACGRLLGVFERIQWAALGDVNATVVDRFYGTASTAPSLVFSRLFKSAQQHLSKLQGDKPGFAVNLQKDLESLTAGMKRFPMLLSLTQQGEFALGFYHQRAAYRKGRGNGDQE